ncbi:MAG: bifunctional adenosylcobinamide kinase/adenosylcobinamide-phosphate guanylyltransferase [Clostridium sp.]|uniref:bifunctional adenosylcobinamide kinase/adenosylcobinamide-phosphate guanylyltransferase n=1 Tax=Clostridium sp. TaxID=1506 RepID=UPI003F414C09
MIIFISGGSKSGKSKIGEDFSKKLHKSGDLIYLATMKPMGNEDLERIENHKKDRIGTEFKAYEMQQDILKLKEVIKREDTVLLDSLTSLMANEMFKGELLLEEERVSKGINEKIFSEIEELSKDVKNLIVVSDYIFSEAIVYDKMTEEYRKNLGYLNRKVSEIADISIYVTYGMIEIFKGKRKLKHEGLI